MAESSIVLRVDSELKQEFEWACEQVDQTVSQALRGHMRKFIDEVLAKRASQIILERSDSEDAEFLYNSDDPEEVLTIKKKLFLCKEFEKRHSVVILNNYDEREKRKVRAYDVMHDKNSVNSERVDAAIELIKVYFMRSAQSSISPERLSSIWTHPDFEEYAKHFIHGVGKDILSEHVYAEVAKNYPLEGRSKMNESSYWPVQSR